MKFAALLACIMLLSGAAFAGTLDVTYPDGGQYVKGTITVDFNILEPTGTPSIFIYKNTIPSVSGPATTIITDANLADGATITCDDYALTDLTPCHYPWNTATTADGNWFIALKAYPETGFSGESYDAYSAAPFVIDNTPPTISNPVPAGGWFNPSVLNLKIDINDNLSGVNPATIIYRFNGTDYNTESALLSYNASTKTLDFNAASLGLAEGSTYDANVDANDLSGNAATRYNYIVGVDATGPSAADINIASFNGTGYAAGGTGYTNDTAPDLA